MSWNVFVTREIPEAGLDLLRDACKTVEVWAEDRAMTKEELMTAVKDRDGVLCLLNDTVDADVLQAANQAEVFSNYAVGYNNIDVAEATRLGIMVTNTPGVLTAATADIAWALLLGAARRIAESDRYVREGKFKGWGPKLIRGYDVTGKTLGLSLIHI
jgi:lactate dehydrogenase-like 2-hydroxyacid dehydrogenase